MSGAGVWSYPVAWPASRGRSAQLRLVADLPVRTRVAHFLELEAVLKLEADLTTASWRNGLEIMGRVEAVVTRLCGVTLEPFDEVISEPVNVRIIPQHSAQAGRGEAREVIVSLDAEDPPDTVSGETVDVGAYVVETLGLALDPFPRKPGARFEAPAHGSPTSPFAVLRGIASKPPRE